jgi:hypothetical protein
MIEERERGKREWQFCIQVRCHYRNNREPVNRLLAEPHLVCRPLLLLQGRDCKLLHGDRRVEAQRIVGRGLVHGADQHPLALLQRLQRLKQQLLNDWPRFISDGEVARLDAAIIGPFLSS